MIGKTMNPPDQQHRERIQTDLCTTMLVEAAAGTGKTTSMVGRMVGLLREGRCRTETLAAVTFTRKAAAELRSRFQVELERQALEATGEAAHRLVEAASHVERCFVGTIHSFCARLLRERPIEAGVPLNFREIEPDEDLRLRERAWSDFVERLYAMDDPVVRELADLGLDLSQLAGTFLAYADYPDVEEWPAPQVELRDLAAITKALEEYCRHIERLMPTFPAERGNDELMSRYKLVLRAVRQRDLSVPAKLMEVLELCKSRVRVVQRNWPAGQKQGKAEKERWQIFTTRHAEPALERWLAKRYATIIPLIASAIRTYDDLRAAAGALNYQDLLMRAATLLRDKPAIRRYFRLRFTHLLVDEFQDTDPVQAQVIMFLTADDPAETDWGNCRPAPGSLFVVGDPKQSIFRFRRADIVTYSQVKKVVENSGGATVPLTANFRAVASVVDWVNEVFTGPFPSEADQYSPAACPLEVGREDGATGELTGVKVLKVPPNLSKQEEAVEYDADFVARYIRHALDSRRTVPRTRQELQAGVCNHARPGDFLIITRQKKHLARYARKLQELGIPQQVTGGSALKDVSELPMLASCLRALVEPENPVALVAVLRGELFGFSDADLYAFRRAGGRFSYRGTIPVDLEAKIAERFQDAFQRLKQYDSWLRQLPPLPALERMVAHLGLSARASAPAGGSGRSGSIAKALQRLRTQQTETYSAADLADWLDDLIERNAEFDGIPALPHDGTAVRLMNLHKVKGLEAPIVFLVDPTGKHDYSVDLHVDRSGDKVRGYIAIYGQFKGRKRPILAKPEQWDNLGLTEQRFYDAEENRLMYVAATRAGTQLTVSRKEQGNHSSYWEFFSSDLQEAPSIADPGPQALPAGQQISVTDDDVAAAQLDVAKRHEIVAQPTYATAAAKEISLTPSGLHGLATGGEHGTEWGTVIHFLLQAAATRPELDLHDLAYTALVEQQMDPGLAETAVQMVHRVMTSDVWRRAASSAERLVEVPFATWLAADQTANGVPTILRGVIDLAFREPAGWVIVDYKTDARPFDALPKLVTNYSGQVRTYSQAWEAIVGQKVHEIGLYFTHLAKYVTV